MISKFVSFNYIPPFFFVIQALIEGIHLDTSSHIGKTTADTNDPH
jgi:hypothetical protein